MDERADILARLSRGEIDVVSNCMVLTEGWDMPAVSCIVLARPTKSMGLFRQMIGRVLRPAPGKDHALVLDHSGAVFNHGFVEDPVLWTLDHDKRATNPALESKGNRPARTLTTCPECSAVRAQGKPCSACGWRPQRKPDAPDVIDGVLGRVERDGRVTAAVQDKARFHGQLLWIAQEKGYQKGWAAHKFKERFGSWPTTNNHLPEPPEPAVRSWVRSRQIAWAKSQPRRAG